MSYVLAADVVSSVKRTIYARKGDEVKLVSTFGNVVIVEDANGVRFPTLKINLKNQDENLIQTTQDPSQDNSGEQAILRRGNSPRNKGGGKAAPNTPVLQPAQKTLW